MLALARLARSKWVELYLERVIEWALSRYTNLRVRDYSTLMSLERDYSVARFKVQEGTWLADKRLNERGPQEQEAEEQARESQRADASEPEHGASRQ